MIEIKQFENQDLELIKAVVKEAFYREDKDSEFNEWNFVDRIRSDTNFVKALCFIAKNNEEYVGYNILTKGSIGGEEGLILGPIAVKPSYQRKGIGKKLIENATKKAENLGYRWIALIGGDYYFQFGFESGKRYGVKIASMHPGNDFVKIKFLNNTTTVSSGNIKFADAFYSDKDELL